MKSRVITAILIMVVVVAATFFSEFTFKIFALAIVAVGTHEFLEIFKEKKFRLISQIIIYALAIIPIMMIKSFEDVNLVYFGLYTLIFFSLLIIDEKIHFEELAYLYTFTTFLLSTGIAAITIRHLPEGFVGILYCVLVTAAADTGGFFAGKFFGKNKLIPRISPNKTVEGFIGGLILSIIIGVLYISFVPGANTLVPGGNPILLSVLFSLILGITAPFGDLIFSCIKRNFAIKDFSNVLPGHGGILDRVDSHLTNFLVFVILYQGTIFMLHTIFRVGSGL